MLAKDLTVTEANGYFKSLAGADEPGQSDRTRKHREQIFGQMQANCHL